MEDGRDLIAMPSPALSRSPAGETIAEGRELFEDANVLEVPPRRGHGRKYQAVNLPRNNPSNPNSNPANQNESNESTNRKLAIRQQGISTVLLLRIEAPDSSTTCSHQDCAAHTFGGVDSNGELDDMNLASQTNDCSYGKLQYLPAPDNALYPGLINGTATVVFTNHTIQDESGENITVAQNVTGVNHGTVLDWAIAAADEVVGNLDQYDHGEYTSVPTNMQTFCLIISYF